MLRRPVHPNIRSNLRFAFKQLNGKECTLSDTKIDEIWQDHDGVFSSGQEQDAAVLELMKQEMERDADTSN